MRYRCRKNQKQRQQGFLVLQIDEAYFPMLLLHSFPMKLLFDVQRQGIEKAAIGSL